MRRFATIDLGTNTAILLVAEKRDGAFVPVFQRAEITRLGQGVDVSRRLLPEAMARSARMLGEYARQAREMGVADGDICAVSTSAARDAANREELVGLVRREGNIELDVIPGSEEARLTWLGATADLDASDDRELCVLDIGGGSSEMIFGTKAGMGFRHSFDVGSVRMAERFLRSDPPRPEERAAVMDYLRAQFATSPKPSSPPLFVGVAGTVTSLFTLIHGIEPYDGSKVHGQQMDIGEVSLLMERLFSLPVEERRKMKGMEPKRADVIHGGAAVLLCAMEHVGVDRLTVSDRGLRWGLMQDRFGGLV